mmetsp:Transcript_34386/g.99033  ORF Transcript_34386/g.99033 Transcript_34386/m.99033 type:complete len:84 (-) Transcript_34386:640-891(-)
MGRESSRAVEHVATHSSHTNTHAQRERQRETDVTSPRPRCRNPTHTCTSTAVKMTADSIVEQRMSTEDKIQSINRICTTLKCQ